MAQPKILVADDSATVRAQICRILSEAGYGVLEANNGLAAVQAANSEPPALAILDIDMPYLDGFGVCHEIKHMTSPVKAIPIVFLTASRSHALEMLGLQLGAYVQKPISPEVLLDVVGRLLSQQQENSAARAHCVPSMPCSADASHNGAISAETSNR
jgi:DNA-binding response OmpR family regulator